MALQSKKLWTNYTEYNGVTDRGNQQLVPGVDWSSKLNPMVPQRNHPKLTLNRDVHSTHTRLLRRGFLPPDGAKSARVTMNAPNAAVLL